MGFPGDSVVKNLPANAGDMGLSPGLGRYPGERHGNPLQYSCLGNSMDRGAWWATVHGIARVGHDLATKQQTTMRGPPCRLLSFILTVRCVGTVEVTVSCPETLYKL